MNIPDQLRLALGDGYTIDRELGGGGMSRVFLATEQSLGRQVVVKILPTEMSGQVSIERFKLEISVAAQLQHPHIVPLLSAGDASRSRARSPSRTRTGWCIATSSPILNRSFPRFSLDAIRRST